MVRFLTGKITERGLPLLIVCLVLLVAHAASADVTPLEAAMVSLDHQHFPFIYLNVVVARFGESIATLPSSSFRVSENGVRQTDYFEVTPPDEGGGVRMADIVFVLDVTGSMGGEIEAVRANMVSFIDALTGSEINYRVGFVVFGDVVYVYNGGSLYADQAEILSIIYNITLGEHGIGGGGDGPENQFEAMAQAASMNFRPGTQKVQILLTDAPAHEADGVTDWTRETILDLLVAARTTLFPVFNTSDALASAQYIPIAEATNPDGTHFDIYDNFDSVVDEIASMVASSYVIWYKSSRPVFDGVERHVLVGISYLGDEATCEGTYVPGSAPRIQRSQDTLDLHDQSWAEGTTFSIRAQIADAMAPYVQSATVYYRRTGDADYTPSLMTHSSDIWAGAIPGGAVSSPGVDYYISATDGQSTVTDPSVDPRTSPHQLAILPNEAPRITHTPPTDVPINAPATITAQVIDTTNVLASARMYYRKVGQLIYQCNGEMTNTAGDSYRDSIPSDYVTAAGVEYYIHAEDDLGVGNCHGTPDVPHVVSVSTNQPPDTTIETAEIDESEGTAKFTWSGSDDATPAANLVFCYRLVKDSSYSEWSSWSSAKTKEYADLGAGGYKFQVRAKDAYGAIDPSPASWEFGIAEAPLNCIVHLRPQDAEASIGVIGDFETFDIYVGASTGDVKRVRFSSDEALDGIPTGEWTDWFDWGSNTPFSPWDAAVKTMAWLFSTGGTKEVWAEVRDGGGSSDEGYAYMSVEVPEWRGDLLPGDILYAPRAIYGIGHVGIYVGDGLTVDPGRTSISHPITSWDYREEGDRKEVMILRVNAPLETRAEAAELALNVAGHDSYTYDWRWVQKNPDLEATWWYCSELVWAVYWNLGVNVEWNLGNNSDFYLPGPVEPYDVFRDADTAIVSAHCRGVAGCCDSNCSVARPPATFNLFSPADMVVTDPDGLVVSKSTCTIPGAVYLEREPLGEGEPEDKIYIAELKIGVYAVLVEPEAGANETEAFSLTFYHQGRELVLADGVLVGDIPDIPYRVTISQGSVSPGNDPPEVALLSPSATDVVGGTLCQVMWYATDADDPAEALAMDLFWSGDGGAAWSTIERDLENSGEYTWDTTGLPGGEYWLKIVAEDPEGATAEATTGPFTISAFEGTIIIGPNPVTGVAGTAFFYSLPDETSTAKLMIFNAVGRPVFEVSLDVGSSRFPDSGTWNPVDQDGVPLANGPYVYVLIADGKVIGQGKMVIQR